MCPRFPVVLLALSLCLATSAQAPAPQPERRTFAVSVLDKDGNAVHGLTAANFRGTFRGQPVKILSATEDSSPRRIALLIDTSRGMQQDKWLWQFVWVAAQSAIERLASPHELVILTFSDETVQHSELTADRTALLGALQKASAREALGPTALYDALVETSKGFGLSRTGDAILVLSDGLDNASYERVADVEQQLAGRGVRACFVWPRPEISPSAGFRQIPTAKRSMTRLADASGGLLLELEDYKPQQAPAAMESVYAAVLSVYRLEVEFASQGDKPVEWTLEVVDADGRSLNNLQLAYPKLFVPLAVLGE